ncbi:MAG: UDP-N-acetylmuramoyl-tripeptide--D-alanyl-D-alanine ligase [Bacilli bacterium]|nr:UDP-N-acetylmuramoyl-tripeptide--D-alanyl-D-alanine ligase [Bacilli bacterium]
MILADLVNICNGEIINKYELGDQRIKKIKLSSQEVKKGDLFIALKGIKYDGHDFVLDVIKNGAKAVIVERDINIKSDIPIIKVESTYNCLYDIAKYNRKLYNIPLIAVTGSVGKTTTKEIIALILGQKYKVLKSQGSDNNHIGVPKTLFNLNNHYDMAVLEIGMNHVGEISTLSNVCQPNVSLITNIGTSHIGNLGSKTKILQAKKEILDGMSDGKLIINGDDKYLKTIKSENVSIINCGTKKGNQLVAYDIESTFKKTTFKIKLDKEYKITFNVPGRHLVNNIIMAIQVGLLYNVPIDLIIKAVGMYKTGDKRMNVKVLRKNNVLIEDCYNSSYESLVGVVDLIKNKPLNKVFILGDVLELGKYSKKIHKKIGSYLDDINNKTVLLVGDEMKNIKRKFLHFPDNQSLISHLKEMELSNSLILVKGSRAMRLEEVTDYLKQI